MLTHDGFYQQIDGLAMGSPPAPNFANGWLSQFDPSIRGDSKLYARYMDEILREIKSSQIDTKLEQFNNYHPKLHFTIEREKDNKIPFLDMKITRLEGRLSSTWYSKDSDTGLTMNFHALAPTKYKRSVVSGMVHRIYSACSTWRNVHESLKKAKEVLENNQYPSHFYDPIIEKTLNRIRAPEEKENENEDEDTPEKKLVFVQYRGKVTDDFERSLKRIEAPCKVISRIRKM